MFASPHFRRTLPLLLALCVQAGCFDSEKPQTLYEHARSAFIQGDLIGSQQEAARLYQRFQHRDAHWAWKFRILEAESMLWRGMYPDVLQVMNTEPQERSAKIQVLALRGAADARLGRFRDADQSLNEARRICAESDDTSCGAVSRARGVLATERRQLGVAEQNFEESLAFARSHQDPVLESTAFLNLGAVALLEGHFDQATTWSTSAYQISLALRAQDIAQNALGNLGWACYRLGESERALSLFLEAIERAAKLGDQSDEAAWLTDAGYVYIDAGKLDLARHSFLRALELEEQVQSKDDIYNVLRVLARLELQTGDLEKAAQYADQALAMARHSGNHVDELYPMLVKGQIALRRGDSTLAVRTFQQVEGDKACPAFLRWEAQHSRARLYQSESQPGAADREYRGALSTFEAARANVQQEDFQLSFLTNAAAIYDDYVHFLVAHGRTEEALRWADYSRARTLSEGLGLVGKAVSNTRAQPVPINPRPLDARALAARAKGAILYYWLGEKQSYLWAITRGKTRLFPLPPAAEINAMAERFRRSLTGPRGVLASSDEDGRRLYRTLVAPARALLTANANIFVIPDGSLNNLNFETLIAEAPTPHYWIEDADIVNASSLRVLASSLGAGNPNHPKLLLMGNSGPADQDYPALPQASAEMRDVAKYFAAAEQRTYAGYEATPEAYVASDPEQFAYIHFVAHGTASRLSPLDSAIVLSRDRSNPDSFKLYAREIVKHPLRAELVTISSCYGAGERTYSGEGLVGLAWAFLRAGAHYVVAALWEATDASTAELMDDFYRELKQGRTPDVALRHAKLSLIHSGGVFSKPFYWAPFQLYTGRERPPDPRFDPN